MDCEHAVLDCKPLQLHVGLPPFRPFGIDLRHTLQNWAEALPGNEPVEQRQAVAQQIQFPQLAVSGEESCLPSLPIGSLYFTGNGEFFELPSNG